MAQPIKANNRVAVVFAEDLYECLELHYPRLRLIEAGYTVYVVGPPSSQPADEKHKATTYKSKEGYWALTNADLRNIDPATVSVAVVPGGWCTDRLRRSPEICQFLRDCWFGTKSGVSVDNSSYVNDHKATTKAMDKGAVVGFICHGAWLPISAKIVKGVEGTCFFSIKDDLINAGMIYSTEKCVADGRMVTAQTPEDLPSFMASIIAIDTARI
eukprot:GILI01010069.1.p1 GENE.GILI01010069.1~~GILI01010069.1.p1  ORF type:complete len:229 (-),score=31.71 GILI01010069.1:43-684(-)